MARAQDGMRYIPASEYEQYPRHHFRDRTGRAYTVYMEDAGDGPIYVKQVTDTVRVQKINEEQWANAILNHGMCESGSDRA
jgi:hypothetical protein